MDTSAKAALVTEFASLQADCHRMDSAAGDRSLTPSESAAYEKNIARMESISEHMARSDRFDVVANVTRSIGLGGNDAAESTNPAGRLGDYASIAGRTTLGRVGNPKFASFAGEDTLGRVVAHGIAADGTAPTTIEGDLVKFVDSNRYAVNAARRLPMPDNHAPTFKRPRLTQSTSVGNQVTEGDILSSQRLQATGDSIAKKTYGGVLALSEQEIDWTEPAMLGLALQDLAEQYGIVTDNVLCDAIEAAATANDSTETVLAASLPTASAFVAAIAAASVVAYASAKKVPDTLFVDTNWWSRLIGIVDTTGRPLFPYAGQAVNPAGTGGGASSFSGFNVLGLNVVVDPNFTADFMCVAVSSLVEVYEQDKGLLTINAPSTLEVQYAYRGYFSANVYGQGIATIEAV